MPEWSSERIHTLLKVKHSEDLYVPECKNGPTQSLGRRALGIMDAWVLVRTWSPMTAIGYEIKVSRSDWLRDQKLGGYFEGCHLFYVVAPKGVVDLSELPPEAGLLEATERRLMTRKKAPRRAVALPEELLVYVLMSRVELKESQKAATRTERVDEWRRWLAEDTKSLGHKIAGRVGERYRDMEQRVHDAERRMDAYDAVRARIQELGFSDEQPVYDWQVRTRLSELISSISPRVMGEIDRAIGVLETLRTDLDGQKKRLEQQAS